jgi:hypothetical protein
MQRRDFLKRSVALAVAAELGATKAQGFVPAHNWDRYDFGSGPPVVDRLNQGPFPQYAPEALIPTDDVVMTATPSEEVVPNYGKGLITSSRLIVAQRKLNRTTFPRPSKTWFAFPWGNSFTYGRLGGRSSRDLVDSSCPIM